MHSTENSCVVAELKSRGIHVSIIVVMLFQLCSLFAREYLRAQLDDAGFSELSAKHFSAFLGFTVLAVLMWPVVRDAWPALRPLFRRPHQLRRTIFSAIMIAILLWVINKLVLMWIAAMTWQDSLEHSTPATPVFALLCEDPKILLLAIPVTAVLTPLFEETINRGLILHTLLPLGKWAAILLSSSLFMVLHIGATYPAAFLFGVVTAMQILAWQNIWGVIATHGTFNLCVEIDRVCLDEYWIPGEISLAIGAPLQNSIALFLLSMFGVYWLISSLTIRAEQE